MDRVHLDAAADELYALEPGEFTAARTELEKQARSAGDKDLAKQIRQLRKPTVTAWVSNLLAHERPDSLVPLRELGDQLREAQQTLQGDELRQLSRQRQRLVHALVQEARGLAAERGQRVTEPVARELEQTLEATLADPTVADTVLAGRLTTAVLHAGFGVGGVVAGAARTAGTREPPAPARPAPGNAKATSKTRSRARSRATSSESAADEAAPAEATERKRAAARTNAERDVEDAERAAQEAGDTAQAAADAVSDVERRQAELTERIAELQHALAAAEEELPVLRRQARLTARERAKAEQARQRVERMRTRARDALEALD